MAGILFKIAKEFNVATTTLVDYLISKGYSIQNKPNAKVNDEMYAVLNNEFKGSAEVKEKADQLQIGHSYKKDDKPARPVPPIAPPPPPPPAPPVVEATPPPPPVTPKATPPVVEEVKQEVKAVEEKSNRPQLKVLGKIDLNPKPKAKIEKPVEKPKAAEEVKEVPKVEPTVPTKKVEPEVKPSPPVVAKKAPIENKVVQPKAPIKKEEPKPEKAPSDESQGEFRAKTPKLAGLKILGKIDTNKLGGGRGKKDSDKKKGKQAPGDKNKSTQGQKTDSNTNRPKRKRKKISANSNSNYRGKGSNANNRGGSRRPAREEVKEVSQKQIDDQIKATMARLTSGGKNKRQKIRRDNRDVKREKQEIQDLEMVETKLKLTEFVSVSELAGLMDVGVSEVITTCMGLGVIVSINQRLDAEIIELVAGEFNFEVEFITAEEIIEEEVEEVDAEEDLVSRAPIVTVMGHVDHGKTSLLDYIRNASVADGEAGGITQHIGAYEVKVGNDDRKITFLDTPGHEAFTAMRARGAKVTDVAIIIIAADDRIMPQTKEAISHAQAAGVPIVFAINKIDKDGADPNRIKQELASMNLLVDDWGGTIQSQEISAKKGTNIDELLEKLLLEADVLELKANPNRNAVGSVIEASLDKGRGFVTKILVQNGTLKIGDSMVAGSHSGKVKAMFNERGEKLKKAGPSSPVLILGLSGAPQAGEKFKIMDSDQDARQLATKRAQIEREQSNRASKRLSLDEIGRRLALGTFKELNLIVKGDVDGSIEALSDSLIKLSVETIQVNVIHKAVGQIIESDVLLASASDAIIIGFQVRPSGGARLIAEKEGVQIKTYSVIYEAIDEIKLAMEGMLEPTQEEKVMGMVEVRETYKISKVGTIAGSYVTEGKITRNAHIRLIRDGVVIYPTKEGVVGEVSSLKRFKDDMKEVKNGMECGLSIKNYNDLRVGDMIEAYEIVEVKRTLNS